MRRFLGACQFLTVIPVRGPTASSGESALFFPLIGALLGASGAAVFSLFARQLGPSIAALLSIGWLIAGTGCLHEDGLADVADAFRAGRSREKIMLVLKDSRIGTYGGCALVVAIGLRWQALMQMKTAAWLGLPVALALSRSALVVLAHIAPPIGKGLGQEFAQGCSRPVAVAVGVQAMAIALLVGWRAVSMIAVSGLIILLARLYFLKRLGGVNGDCLGATCQVVETVNLLLLTWPLST